MSEITPVDGTSGTSGTGIYLTRKLLYIKNTYPQFDQLTSKQAKFFGSFHTIVEGWFIGFVMAKNWLKAIVYQLSALLHMGKM